jgi:hypothetical protein
MKFLLIIFVSKLMLLSNVRSGTSVTSANNVDNTESMAIFYIFYTLKVCELDNTNEKQQKILLNRLSKHIFTYWYESHILKSKRMDTFEATIKSMYGRSLDRTDKLSVAFKEHFSNPLGLDESGLPYAHKTYGIKINTMDEYNKLIKEFNAFLEKK